MDGLITSLQSMMTPLQGAGLFSNGVSVWFKDEHKILGLGGRKMARVFAIAALTLFSVDRGWRGLEKNDPVLIGGTIALLASAGRSTALFLMPDVTERDKHWRQRVVIASFAIGAPIAVGATCIKTQKIDPVPVALIVSGLSLASLADLQRKQKHANQFALGSAICFGSFAAYNYELGIVASNALAAANTGLSLYINRDAKTAEPTPPVSAAAQVPKFIAPRW